MSVVKINAISVPPERHDELVARFAARAGEVSGMAGFEAFELLRPSDDRDTFLVYTRWRSEDDFQAWMTSPAFQHGHRQHGASGNEAGATADGPVSTHAELWQFDVVQHEDPPTS
jgi:heme-degrading monooxygenase HmoA